MRVSDAELARRATRYEAMKRVLIVFTAVVVTACLGTLVVLSGSIIAIARQSHRTGRENHQTLAVIKGCTQPGGACYQRSQKATAAAVASINRVVVLAAACASQRPGQSVAEIQSCVIDRLASHRR